MYVREDYRRKGVFSTLYRRVESLARQDPDICALRLYVEEGNRRAQKTWLNPGMVSPGYQVIEIDFCKGPN